MGCSSSTTVNKDIVNERIVLGYWAAPLQGQPARYVLELANHSYEDKLYTPDTAKDWFGSDKQNLGFNYPNLPFLIHGDYKITESQNIVNYLVDITNQKALQGEGEIKYKVDNIRFVCSELIGKIFQASRKEGEEKQTAVQNDVVPKIKQLHTVLGAKNQFFDHLTLADIYAYITVSNLKRAFPDTYKQFETTFDAFITKFENIPAIKAYHASDRYGKIHK